jgi:dolichol-phosphate mannosyltransferase
MKITVVIPAYNERDNIERLVNGVSSNLRDICDGFSMIFVYEGEDGGEELLEHMAESADFIRVKYSSKSLGIGGALKSGFRMIPEDTSHVLTMDADLSHDPRDIHKLLKAAATADIIVGSRYVKRGKIDQMPLVQKVISRLANSMISVILGIDANDLSSNFRLYDAKVIKAIQDSIVFNDYAFFPESLIVAYRKGYKIKEVPITFYRRERGKSKLNLFRTGLAYVRLIRSYYFANGNKVVIQQ